jgi:hypothetical protein
MKKLKQRGFLVKKIGGTMYTQQLPDFYAAKRGVTIFFESKFVRAAWTGGFLPSWLKITPQMLSMSEHERSAIAAYLIFVHDGKTVRCMDFRPSEIRAAISAGEQIHRPMKEIDEWVRDNLEQWFGSPASKMS